MYTYTHTAPVLSGRPPTAGPGEQAALVSHDMATLVAVADALKLPGNPNLRHELTQVRCAVHDMRVHTCVRGTFLNTQPGVFLRMLALVEHAQAPCSVLHLTAPSEAQDVSSGCTRGRDSSTKAPAHAGTRAGMQRAPSPISRHST